MTCIARLAIEPLGALRAIYMANACALSTVSCASAERITASSSSNLTMSSAGVRLLRFAYTVQSVYPRPGRGVPVSVTAQWTNHACGAARQAERGLLRFVAAHQPGGNMR